VTSLKTTEPEISRAYRFWYSNFIPRYLGNTGREVKLLLPKIFVGLTYEPFKIRPQKPAKFITGNIFQLAGPVRTTRVSKNEVLKTYKINPSLTGGKHHKATEITRTSHLSLFLLGYYFFSILQDFHSGQIEKVKTTFKFQEFQDEWDQGLQILWHTNKEQESPANAKGTRDSSACMKAHCKQM